MKALSQSGAATGHLPGESVEAGGRAHAIAVVLLTVAGSLIRLRYLDQPMRYDEAYSYLFFVQVPFVTTISDYSLPNQHILNSLLMRLTAGVFGADPWSLRLPAFVFGAALVPATYYALRRFFGANAALLACAYAAVSAPLIVYATNARGYSLVVLLFLGMVAVSAAMSESPGRRGWPWLVVMSVIGLYTIPVMLYAIGGIFIWHGVRAWPARERGMAGAAFRPVMRSALLVLLLTVVLYVPVLIGTGLGPLIANDWVTARTPTAFLAELPAALRALWQSWHAGMPAAALAVLLAGVAAYVLLPDARRSSQGFVACILLWCAALLLVTMRPPFARVWLFLLPLYFAAASAGVLALIRRLAPAWTQPAVWLLAFGVCAWSTVSVTRSAVIREIEGPVFPDAEAVVTYLESEVRPGDGVYARTPADAPIWYYTWRRGLSDRMLRLKYNAQQRVLVVVNEATGQTIDSIIDATPLGNGKFTEPVMRRQFESSRVYEVRRLP